MKGAKQNYDIAAYYWPAYHDEPRWRQFMPQGEGEWQTVRQSAPKFEGHYQPRVPMWGYEDESDPAVMQKKIAAAVTHGVNVFIFDWYWYLNQPFLENALQNGFIKAGNCDQMRFYIMWANHNATTLWDLEKSHRNEVVWPGAVDLPTFKTATRHIIERYFRHPSYYLIGGKPVFSIYELGTLMAGLGGIRQTREALDEFRAEARAAGFPGVHIQAILWGNIPSSLSMIPGDRNQTQDNTIKALGIDSLTNYQWCHYVHPEGKYEEWAEQAVSAWERWVNAFSVPFYPHVSIGWDTNPRFKNIDRNLITGSNPELFGKYLERALAFANHHRLSPRLITVNSWNEWSESSYLEPDMVHGMGYLEAVRNALKKK
jgi:hypothetical protein